MYVEKQLEFFKAWSKKFKNGGDNILYRLVSYSSEMSDIDVETWGHRSEDFFKKLNYVIVCLKDTGMPLFVQRLNKSFYDLKSLNNMLSFLHEFGLNPNSTTCDTEFAIPENIDYMLQNNKNFSQVLLNN
ncbi:MAG: hypothetical protein LBF68_07625 [Christensenellaceae bacterium]|jgi:hypothetical protein|nr:hypothetical protein [Christensenellaceae bacterium]